MPLSDIMTFCFVASLLVMSPGPNGMLIAKTVPASGRRAGFATVLGFVGAFYLHGALSVLGISVLLMHSAIAFGVVKYLGVAYLTWIGVKSLISAWRPAAQTARSPKKPPRLHSPRRACLEGFVTNALNPKVSMFYLAAFPQFLPESDAGWAAPVLLVVLHSAINAVWFGGMVLMVSTLSDAVRAPRVQRALRGFTGMVFIGFGLKLATLRATP
ncbi:LysE family translocator [Rhodobacteraceae bacterium]|nr:LysE family translocator [Paracoccaceae bacterium]